MIETFKNIQRRAIAEAERVRVPFSEFVEGVEAMRDELNKRLAAEGK
jgi:hypothetical protein